MKFKDNMSIRKKYMRDIYSQYWITAREKIYGFTQYDKNLIKYELNPCLIKKLTHLNLCP